MATKPTVVPTWATGGIRTTPSGGQQASGFANGDRPPAGWLNWLFGYLTDWIAYLNAPAGTGSGAGLTATGGPTNGTGLVGGGVGSGAGVAGVGGATGSGVYGQGGATSGNGGLFLGAGANSGVNATGGATNGKGVSGIGVGSGEGVKGQGGATGVGVTGFGGATSGNGGAFTGGAGGGVGVVGTGTAGNAGVIGNGNVSNGDGVEGQGNGTGSGVAGYGGATGAGVYGLGTGGHGVVAESDTTSPAKAALRIVPQDADPSSSPAAGDFYVNITTGKLVGHNGTTFDRYIGQSFVYATDEARTSTGSFSNYSYSIPANTLRVGSTIRVHISGILSAYTSGSVSVSLNIGSNLFSVTMTGPAANDTFMFTGTYICATIGAAGVIRGDLLKLNQTTLSAQVTVNNAFTIDTTAAVVVKLSTGLGGTATLTATSMLVDIT